MLLNDKIFYVVNNAVSKVQKSFIYLHIDVGPLSRPCFGLDENKGRDIVCGSLPGGQVIIISINKIIQTCNTIFLVYIYFNFINIVCFELISRLSGSEV